MLRDKMYMRCYTMRCCAMRCTAHRDNCLGCYIGATGATHAVGGGRYYASSLGILWWPQAKVFILSSNIYRLSSKGLKATLLIVSV